MIWPDVSGERDKDRARWARKCDLAAELLARHVRGHGLPQAKLDQRGIVGSAWAMAGMFEADADALEPAPEQPGSSISNAFARMALGVEHIAKWHSGTGGHGQQCECTNCVYLTQAWFAAGFEEGKA